MALLGAFQTWAPNLFKYYQDHMRPLFESKPALVRNFTNSVYPVATFNFGPDTCTVEHVDSANLPFGWCAISALGQFDHTKGGHLVLWDLSLVVEFPAGSTILVPSAAIRHSNVPIQENERRYSFTQYCAGALIRWVDQGLQPTSSHLASLKGKERVKFEKEDLKRWSKGIDLFSTLKSLRESGMKDV